MKRIAIAEPPYISAARERLLGWWAQRNPRERLLIALFGTLAGAALAVTLVLQPLLAAKARARADLRAYELVIARLRGAAPAIRSQQDRRTGSPGEIVATSAAQFGIALQRSEAAGDGVHVIVAGADFDSLARWLADIERTGGIGVRSIRLERLSAPGMVDADMVLSR